MRDNLMRPDLVEEFVRAYHEETNRKASETSANLAWARKKIANLTRQIDAIIDSIAEGIKSAAMMARLELLEAEKAELERQAASPTPTPIRLHPKLPEIYRAKVEKLAESFSVPEVRDEAAELLRGLIDEIAVRPKNAGTEVHVKGDIAKMVRFANPKIQQNQCTKKAWQRGPAPPKVPAARPRLSLSERADRPAAAIGETHHGPNIPTGVNER